ncbi:MAG: FHA domain-containing protein, partial [Dermatophilaceae bacterium]
GSPPGPPVGSPPGPPVGYPSGAGAPPRPSYPVQSEPPASFVDPAERPWLELHGDHYPLLGPRTVLGRDSGADVTIDDAGVSRRHAEIRVTRDGPHYAVTIRDLNSTNGTYVNGDRVDSHRLADGDRLTLGRSTLSVRTARR